MKRLASIRAFSLVGAVVLAACADHPVSPLDEPGEMDMEDLVALEVLSDPQAVESALAFAEMNVTAAARQGMGAPQREVAHQLAIEARSRFARATKALGEGDRQRAVEEAREARRLLARAMQMANGSGGIMSLVERVEELTADVAQDPEAFDEADSLRGELNTLAERARFRLQQRDSLGAAALGVLAQLRYQHRCRDEGDPEMRRARAELGVALAETAVNLAVRLLGAEGPDPEQARFLEAAKEYSAQAVNALEIGELARAVYLAHHARWAALKAVVLPGEVTVEEARTLSELAHTLYSEAEAAVGNDPTELQAWLLDRAARLIAAGEARLAEGYHRGIGALWNAAVICSWLAG
ncbi:MAG: hypothetical protein P8170_21645 [Gemmatimonadota bacterium]